MLGSLDSLEAQWAGHLTPEDKLLWDELAMEEISPLFPLPLLAMPMKTVAPRSSRLRQRLSHKRSVCKWVNRQIVFLNQMSDGNFNGSRFDGWKTACPMDEYSSAQRTVVEKLVSMAQVFLHGRRTFGLTGGSSEVLMLLKQAHRVSGYTRVEKQHAQVSLIADRVVEPSTMQVIPMLDALPPLEAQFYAQEKNCIDVVGKSTVMQDEIEQQYGFVGGSLEEYSKYFRRADWPDNMWTWMPFSEVKAVAGFSVVLKKDGKTQRKLLMACSFNYWLQDIERRSRLGMDAGGAINRLHLTGNGMQVATCDESNAFTYVQVPEWFWAYQACPPVVASQVWDLLPVELKNSLNCDDLVSPAYKRLAMGCSHSVHILMQINMKILGQTLHHHPLLCRKPNLEDDDSVLTSDNDLRLTGETELFYGCPDDVWWKRQELRKSSEEEGGKSVQEWLNHIKSLRGREERCFVVLLLFSGERRQGDVQDFLEQMASFHGLQIDVMSADLALDARWDLSRPSTFSSLMEAAEYLVDAIGGGPPCATTSRARFNRNCEGPRPVRFRQQFWGRDELTRWERSRVAEANVLYLNSMALMERTSSRGGLHWWEHPADPGEDPYPSIWATAEMQELERRLGAQRVSFHQCVFGAPVAKHTTLSTTCPVTEELQYAICPGLSGDHVHHGMSQGTNEKGLFHTRRLQTYPPLLCKAIANMMIQGLQKLKVSGLGPTGFHRLEGSTAPTSAWSTTASDIYVHGIHVLNEANAHKQHKVVTEKQSAVYVHVDDTVVVTHSSAAVPAKEIMNVFAEAYESDGFLVPERVYGEDIGKVLGFEVDQSRCLFQLPKRKQILLHDALIHVSNSRMVDVEVLRMLVGIWMRGAQLNRDLMSIEFSVYHFMEKFEQQFAVMWLSVRRELAAMARGVPFMQCDVSRSFSRLLWASDAQGAGEGDNGGYGITLTCISKVELEDILESAETWGRTVARLGGELTGAKNPFKQLVPTVPFTLLPESLFDMNRWRDVQAGRWKFADHHFREARTVFKVVQKLGNAPHAHNRIHVSLQDNQPCAASYTKGRSSSWPLMFLLRKKSAICLAAGIRLLLPWVESVRMPADSLSRAQRRC